MQKLIVANYKMNGDVEFYKTVQQTIKNLKVKDTELVLCPPFVYVPNLKINRTKISIGVQDIACEETNKCTGQIGPNMLKEFGVTYAIVGHSERRQIGESNELVSKKVLTSVSNGITPIICVGEQSKQSSLNVLKTQVQIALSKIKTDKFVIAYEPVWAIGSGEIPTNNQINKAINIIKETTQKMGYNNIKVLYGGSVNENNYKDLLTTAADGFLLGGISLKLDKFFALVKGVDNA